MTPQIAAALPGFPETISEQIEMPHMAELLCAPMFRVADAELVYRKGAEFQRRLLERTPLRNNRKHVTVFSAVHLLAPSHRAMTTGNDDASDLEWHIDTLEGSEGQHLHPEETVHLLLSGSQFVTEFNTRPLEITDPRVLRMSTEDFNRWLNDNCLSLGISGKPIECDRIYTFENHVHRAPAPTRLEFRYSWRVRETDRDDLPPAESQIVSNNSFFNTVTQQWESNIAQRGNIVMLNYPPPSA